MIQHLPARFNRFRDSVHTDELRISDASLEAQKDVRNVPGLVLGSDHPFIIEKTIWTIKGGTNEKRCTHLLALSSDFSWVRVSEKQ